MPSARLPENEADRLQALRRSGLVESGPDGRLNEIVRDAAALFGMPIAAISLLTETRQVFKACVGLGVPDTARDLAFCGYAILGRDPLVVLDAQTDARFADNMLVLGAPGIRCYVGAPVHGAHDQPFGALCVIDTTPRAAVTPAQLDGLRMLADEVSKIFAAGHPAAARDSEE